MAACDRLLLVGGLPEPKVATRGALPIELDYRERGDGLVILGGRVDGKVDVDFILDTGAPVTVLLANDRTAPLGIDTSNARRLGPRDDPASPVGVIRRGLAVTFGNLSLTDLAAVVLPESTLACPDRYREVGFDAVIGADLFRRFVIEVDPTSRRVRLHEPSTWTAPAKAATAPIRIEGGHAYVNATLHLRNGEAVTLPMHVDTGMTTSLALVADSHAALPMPVDGAVTRACFVSGRRELRAGPPVSLTLGDARFDDVPTRFTTKQDAPGVQQQGAIGSGLLSKRRYAIDYPGRRIVFL